MMENKGLEISQETFYKLAIRYWAPAIFIVLAAGILGLLTKTREDYFGNGIFIGGGIGVIIGRLILAAVLGEPQSRQLDHFWGAIVIGLPLSVFFLLILDDTLIFFFPAVVIGAVLGPYLMKLIRRLVLPKWLRIFIGGILIVGVSISALLNPSIFQLLAPIFIGCGVIGASLWYLKGAIAQYDVQLRFQVAYLLGVGFAIFGITLGVLIKFMLIFR